MAFLPQLTVARGTQEQFNELDAKVGQFMMQAGGPPAGLMSHAVYPEGYFEDVLRLLIAESGLTGEETVGRPVWSFARPWTTGRTG